MTAPPPFHASKWLKLQMLIDAHELEKLFAEMGNFTIHPIGKVIDQGKEITARESYLKAYEAYVTALLQGHIPDNEPETSAVTSDANDLHITAVGPHKQLLRVIRPVIQLHPHRFGYSPIDGKFRSNVLGKDSVMWGIQFSYPQIYQDPVTKEIITVTDQTTFPNAVLFKKIRLWMRDNTIPTPFLADQTKTNVPFRLGKHCISEINRHPQLNNLNIKVLTDNYD